MPSIIRDDRSYRGLLQSDDGVISKVIESGRKSIRFQTSFGLSDHLIDRLARSPEHIVFSERSRIARLGVQITSDRPGPENIEGHTLTLVQEASPGIPGYPGLDELREFFDIGLPVGRLVFCDPDALLTSEQVMDAINKSELKLPASTAIASDGSIVISPHKVVCELREEIDKNTFGRILLREDGRELLNWHQVRTPVPAVSIAPGKGVITTCSMYLNDHYVVLQGEFDQVRNLPATVLDPIKTRGVHIYLEIVNGSEHPILNPLISARIYRTPKYDMGERRKDPGDARPFFSYRKMRNFEKRLKPDAPVTCHHQDKPVSLVEIKTDGLKKADILCNGPDVSCNVSKAQCAAVKRDFSPRTDCAHVYATSKIEAPANMKPGILALKYFPNMMEHRDIINLAHDGKIDAIYFFEPSFEHGQFLSQHDHHRLQEYYKFGLDVYWVSGLNQRMMVHTIRDGKGYFVATERLGDFHKSMLFAFYGSTMVLSEGGVKRLGDLMDALVGFWGKHIGIVTGGGSGVMEEANTQARKRGILSGANFLDITDQSMTTDVDFCQVFQSTCRHARQKWFEIASFPIFNVGGLGTVEELGITLCNLKLSIMDPVPLILFDTEGNKDFWNEMLRQIETMVRYNRAPAWVLKYIVITDDPGEVISSYRERLQLF
ncbi:MAG: hypothetical protein GY859_31370 [Desulfobacterales bacterium]|nr:hypothetical protein [Desulfobacterales bacterium]